MDGIRKYGNRKYEFETVENTSTEHIPGKYGMKAAIVSFLVIKPD